MRPPQTGPPSVMPSAGRTSTRPGRRDRGTLTSAPGQPGSRHAEAAIRTGRWLHPLPPPSHTPTPGWPGPPTAAGLLTAPRKAVGSRVRPSWGAGPRRAGPGTLCLQAAQQPGTDLRAPTASTAAATRDARGPVAPAVETVTLTANVSRTTPGKDCKAHPRQSCSEWIRLIRDISRGHVPGARDAEKPPPSVGAGCFQAAGGRRGVPGASGRVAGPAVPRHPPLGVRTAGTAEAWFPSGLLRWRQGVNTERG